MKRLIAIAALLLLGGCSLFQQVPGRVTNGTVTSEAGGVWGKSNPVPGGCPGIEFMGAQNVGKVSASCGDHGGTQSIVAESIDANSVLQSAINGQIAMGQQLSDVAKAALAMLGTAGKVASGGIATLPPLVPPAPTALGPMSSLAMMAPPGRACPDGTLPSVITSAGVTCE